MYFTLARHEGLMVSEALDASTFDSANTTACPVQVDARLTQIFKYPTGQTREELVFPFKPMASNNLRGGLVTAWLKALSVPVPEADQGIRGGEAWPRLEAPRWQSYRARLALQGLNLR